MESNEFAIHASLEDTHWWFTARRLILAQFLRQVLPPDPAALVVEIGCGTGGNLKYFQQFYRVMGVDVSPEAVRFARQRVTCPIFLGDFAVALEPYWADIASVILPDVLEHVSDDAALLGRIVAALKPGGIVMLTVPALRFLWSGHDEVLGHLRRYTAAELKMLWRDLPVTVEAFSYFNSILFPAIACVRLLHAGRRGGGDESSLKPVPRPFNALLYRLFAAERLWLRRMSFPFGTSLCAVLRKRP